MSVGVVPVRESVGAALRFVRENVRFIVSVALIYAIVSTLIAGLTLSVPQLGVLTMVANGVVQAFCYGALTAGALFGVDTVRSRWHRDGWRVWSSMVVVGFFMTIVMFVITIPVTIALVAGPLGSYAPELQAAGSDQDAVMRIMVRFVEENPMAILVTALFFFVVWLLLTSRLYLAAPASVEAGRILTFETWKWTRGATLRITWARFMLLVPAYALMFALTALFGRIFGFNVLDGASMQAAVAANPIGVVIFEFITSFIVLALYSPLEAGLSAYLYKGLKPADAPAPSARPAV